MFQSTIFEYVQLACKTANSIIQRRLADEIVRLLDEYKHILNSDIAFKDKLKISLIDAIVDCKVAVFIPILKAYFYKNDDSDGNDYLTSLQESYLIDIADIEPAPALISKPEQIPQEKLSQLEELLQTKNSMNHLFGDPNSVNPAEISFAIGEIVGIQDINKKWWMARVLAVHEDKTTCNEYHKAKAWYYVHLEGFSDQANEWVVHGPRIEKFNANKHIYRQSMLKK